MQSVPEFRETALVYMRISTPAQRFDKQRLEIERYCAEKGVEIKGWFSDVCSGDTPVEKRNGFLDLINRARRVTYVIAAARDRFARDLIVDVTIEKMLRNAGVRIVTLDGGEAENTPAAILSRQVTAAVAAYERAVIRARVRAGLAARKKRGLPLGGRTFVSTTRGAEVWEVVQRLVASGLCYTDVAQALNDMGYRTKYGHLWRERSIMRLIHTDRHVKKRAGARERALLVPH